MSVNLKDGKARLLEYFNIEALIAEAKDECLIQSGNDENVGGSSGNKIINSEEHKMLKMLSDPKVRRLEEVKEKVPKSFKRCSSLELEVIDLIYNTGGADARTYKEVSEITKIPRHLIKTIDKEVAFTVCKILGY